MTAPTTIRAVASRAAEGLLDLVLPADCAACGARSAPGRVVCDDCLEDVLDARFRRVDGTPGPVLVGRDPPTWAAAEYGGALGRLVVAHKDGARRDAVDVLAPLAAGALRTAVRAVRGVPGRPGPGGRLLVVPVPSRPAAVRRRGDRPVGELARSATALVGPAPDGPAPGFVDVLRHARRVADQSGLGRDQRRRNLDGALRVRRRRREDVDGADCVLVDDVTTTGATLAEGARALRGAGARLVVAAVVAAVP